MRSVVLVLLACGCNQVFGIEDTLLVDAGAGGPDLDKDGVIDFVDDCFAAAADADISSDGDTLANADDPCPLDADEDPADGDADGIPDTCDPFPAIPGDRLLCLMAFQDPAVTSALFRTREGELGWDLAGAPTAETVGDSRILVATTDRIERAPSTTYDVAADYTAASQASVLRVSLRAGVDSAEFDVACGTAGGRAMTYVGSVGTGSSATIPFAMADRLRIRATIQGSGSANSVRCKVSTGGQSVEYANAPFLRAGRFGLQATGWNVVVGAVAVYTRDNTPVL
ncbi:MAG: hypothetical protein JWP01_4193 [Myxococcales bacterium]|nr:hypothetical protein [Myxococcales bacterium]